MRENVKVNQVKEHLASVAQAILQDESIQVEFDVNQKNNFFSWNQNLVAEKLFLVPQVLVEQNQIEEFRAASDLALCYSLFHDKEISAKNQRNSEEQKFFDDFEKIRVLANIKGSYLGIAKNILAKIEEDIYSDSGNLSLVLLREIFADKILPRTGIAAEELKVSLSKKILGQIKNLTKKIESQSDFENAVEKLLEMLRDEEEANKKDQEQDDENKLQPQTPKDDSLDVNEENIEMENQLEDSLANQETGEADASEQEKEITDFKEDEKGGLVKVKSEKTTFAEEKIEFKNAYKIFTSKFDEVVFPQKLVSKNELELLRDQLDLKMMKLDDISRRMTLKLKRKLMAKKNSYVEKDNNSGVLDRKKLTQFVLDPFMEDIWINNKEREYQDTALTILLDNSGSMRGQPIVMSALACEIIAGILEKFSIKTEIIGFTTADWKGGRAHKMWESSGRQKNPGRLNELRHIIYKSANQSFKKSKVNLGLMLKEGILKENIDGEALLFAKSRLMQRDEKRKILMVISDGTPIDDSTNSTNDEDILSDHLHHVINKIEKQSKIEVVGIGIGHSADEFYHNSITIKGLEELGDVMIEKLTTLL
ncbi:MAG: hypothetical protein KGQ36_07340 [Rickettsiales bacterium]|nr:hypothetical protein [Rickettsiales bacterium]